ncbi:hypothetical protein [Ottowia sp.]|uniref:hypothetical protein n=1 Tax=Ottowia sp. TaxID=1898956 RepID=UPI0025F8FBB1|nr:hypothetical protein [Ottowia sp.]
MAPPVNKEITLPLSEDGYYRFGKLPGLIADALYPGDEQFRDHLTKVVIWRDDGTKEGQYFECTPPQNAQLEDFTRSDEWSVTPLLPTEAKRIFAYDMADVQQLPPMRREFWPDGSWVVTKQATERATGRAWNQAMEQDWYARRLTEAAQMQTGASGRLQVVDSNHNEVEFRDGSALNEGYVHIDWLNGWGATQQPARVFINGARPIDGDAAQPVDELPANAASPSQQSGPQSLRTTDIAHAFKGLYPDDERWKKQLGNKPKWLKGCIALPGQRGVRETQWYPVLVGGALVRKGYAKQNQVRARFQTVPTLKPWLEAWRTYEADYLDEC